ALAQINPTVGDIDGNAERILRACAGARDRGADLVVLPELALIGYPPRDLVERPSFVRRNRDALASLARRIDRPAAIVGFVDENPGNVGKPLRNAAALLAGGRVVAVRAKALLPTYDVFDEARYFEPGEIEGPIPFEGLPLGLTICEDLWNDEDLWKRPPYHRDRLTELARAGIAVILNISASPFHAGKEDFRRRLCASAVHKHGIPLVFVNQVGGNDELIFDGGSFVLDGDGRLVAQLAAFEEDLAVVDLEDLGARPEIAPVEDECASIEGALILGVRDYARKCGFRRAVLGLSGGIDSSLVAVIAARALGPENVIGVSMPSRYSSAGSRTDAEALARNLGIRYETIPIEEVFAAYLRTLAPVFEGLPQDVTEENLQARIRGAFLMALSNKFGALLLTTGNKSEIAVGYATLYGDMCGGLAVISDLPKTLVYRVSRHINREREIIPAASIEKAPSAELRPDQKDEDSLPPYDVLDPILKAFIEDRKGVEEIVEMGYDRDLVADVLRRVDRNEYKRRQAAPGLKVTTRAFGVGWRMPIARGGDP
ncbi:MAG: NAD+ synthase, partial [Planctomycetes bacterium]|nr:NAD+ synthase [Planctomycetota bacterium]